MKPMTKTFVLICLASTAMAMPAHAQSLPPVVQVLLNNWKNQINIEPTYGTVETDASGNITISNLAIRKAAEGVNPGVKLMIREIQLEGVSEAKDGLYEIGDATFSGMSLEVSGSDGMSFAAEIPEATVETWYVMDAGQAPTPDASVRASMNIAEKISSGKLTFTAMGQTVTSDGYVSTWDGDPVTGAGTFDVKLLNTVIPESTLAAIDPVGTLKQLGYSGLAFDLLGDGKMDIAAGKFGFDMNVAYVGKGMGTLKLSMGATDIPLVAYAEILKANATGAPPDFAALMPQLQSISIGGVSLRFEDGSITKKLLPLAAAMQGMDEATMIANAGAMLQIGLMQLNNQAFTTQVVGAVNSFLKDPESITVALEPAAPIKVQELMSLNPANPGEAITKLGVSVTAND